MELHEFWRRHTFIVQWNTMRSIMLKWLTRWCLEHIHILMEESLNLGYHDRFWLNRTSTLSSTDWMDINLPTTSNWPKMIGLEQQLKWYNINWLMLMPQTTSQHNLTNYAWTLNSFHNPIKLGVDILQKYYTQDKRGYQLWYYILCHYHFFLTKQDGTSSTPCRLNPGLVSQPNKYSSTRLQVEAKTSS